MMTTTPGDVPGTTEALRRELLHLAREQDDLATAEGAGVPYWAPCPPSVEWHRAAATALREAADRVARGVRSSRDAASVPHRTRVPLGA